MTVGGKAHAADYLIKAAPKPGLTYDDPERWTGAFKHKPFTYLVNWWTSWDELNSKVTLKKGDNVYFGPGVNIGNIEIATSGINLYGNNKDCLGWFGTDKQGNSSKTRLDETKVTGRITIKGGVSNVTIAGFYFTGEGQVFADEGGNSNIQVLNNVIGGMTATNEMAVTKKIANSAGKEDNFAVFYFGKAYRGNKYTKDEAYNR